MERKCQAAIANAGSPLGGQPLNRHVCRKWALTIEASALCGLWGRSFLPGYVPDSI